MATRAKLPKAKKLKQAKEVNPLADALIEAMAIIDKMSEYADHTLKCPVSHAVRAPKGKCNCGFASLLVKARQFGVMAFLTLCFCTASAQTNLPAKPMPTHGAVQEYYVMCTECWHDQYLVPYKIKKGKKTKVLNGYSIHRTLYFHCSARGCLKNFTSEDDILIANAVPIQKKDKP